MEATHTWRRPAIRNSPFWVTVSPYKTLSKLLLWGETWGRQNTFKILWNKLIKGLDSASRNVGVARLCFVFIWVFSRSSKFLLAWFLCRIWSQGLCQFASYKWQLSWVSQREAKLTLQVVQCLVESKRMYHVMMKLFFFKFKNIYTSIIHKLRFLLHPLAPTLEGLLGAKIIPPYVT